MDSTTNTETSDDEDCVEILENNQVVDLEQEEDQNPNLIQCVEELKTHENLCDAIKTLFTTRFQFASLPRKPIIEKLVGRTVSYEVVKEYMKELRYYVLESNKDVKNLPEQLRYLHMGYEKENRIERIHFATWFKNQRIEEDDIRDYWAYRNRKSMEKASNQGTKKSEVAEEEVITLESDDEEDVKIIETPDRERDPSPLPDFRTPDDLEDDNEPYPLSSFRLSTSSDTTTETSSSRAHRSPSFTSSSMSSRGSPGRNLKSQSLSRPRISMNLNQRPEKVRIPLRTCRKVEWKVKATPALSSRLRNRKSTDSRRRGLTRERSQKEVTNSSRTRRSK